MFSHLRKMQTGNTVPETVKVMVTEGTGSMTYDVEALYTGPEIVVLVCHREAQL